MKKSLMALTCAVTLAFAMPVVAADLTATNATPRTLEINTLNAKVDTLTSKVDALLDKDKGAKKSEATLTIIKKKLTSLFGDPRKAIPSVIIIAIMYRMASKKPVQNPTQFPSLQTWSATELSNYLTTLYFWAEDKVIAPKGEITEESKDGLDDKKITIPAGGLNKVAEKLSPFTKVIATCKTIKDIGDVLGLVV